MSGQDRDYIQEIQGQMQAAQALIESLEEEVTSLRRDLEQASIALKAAQEEVAAREDALEEKEIARSATEEKVREISGTITELRIQSSNEQLSLTNQHIAEVSRLQDWFQDQLRAEIEAALSAEDREELREEHRKVQQSMEARYEERITALEGSYREAKERVLEGEQEFGEKRSSEIEAIQRDAEDQKRELEQKLRDQMEERLQEAVRLSSKEYEQEIKALRKSLEAKEPELQAELEAHQAELEARAGEADEQHQAKLREIKGLAETREQELRKTHSARLAETKAEAERRIESLRSQREADKKALRARHEEDLAQLRTKYENRIEEAAEQSRWDLWTAQEKLEGIKLERTAEAAAYRDRLRALEDALQTERFDDKDTEVVVPESPEPGPDAENEAISSRAARQLHTQIEELKAALSISEGARDKLMRELDESPERRADESRRVSSNGQGQGEGASGQQADDLEANEDPTQEIVRELEIRLQEAREESRRNSEELQQATEKLQRLSGPEHRMRAGISAFNTSEHARHVSSISKSLGLPEVRAGMDEEANKAVFTFVWEELAWRKYVAEPAEDLQEPRVYLLGGGDEPGELGDLDPLEPNARVDAQGRLILGVRAR
ncbi:hypothetical protein BH24ACT22_BH24ACT22_03440 [soil metagenome]